MDYLIYDECGNFIDVLKFNSTEELNKYKSANPKYNLEKADDIIFDEEDLVEEEDFE